MPGLCRYSKKVSDEYSWTQTVPDDPHMTALPPIPPIDAQITPKDFLFEE